MKAIDDSHSDDLYPRRTGCSPDSAPNRTGREGYRSLGMMMNGKEDRT